MASAYYVDIGDVSATLWLRQDRLLFSMRPGDFLRFLLNHIKLKWSVWLDLDDAANMKKRQVLVSSLPYHLHVFAPEWVVILVVVRTVVVARLWSHSTRNPCTYKRAT